MSTSQGVIFSSRFRYAHQVFLFGRARLYRDRIVFRSVSWNGLRRRTVMLAHITRVSWRTDSEKSANMTLYVQGTDPIRVWLTGAGLWKYRIEELLDKRLSVYDDLPGDISSASAA